MCHLDVNIGLQSAGRRFPLRFDNCGASEDRRGSDHIIWPTSASLLHHENHRNLSIQMRVGRLAAATASR